MLGRGGARCEIVVDPLEGTDLVARGDSGAVAICAIGEPGGFLSAPDIYMQKLGRGRDRQRAGSASKRRSQETLEIVALCYGRRVQDLTTIVLDRPRHEELIDEIRAAGARIRLIPDGDITASLSVAVSGTGDHLYTGQGGSTEGVITAAALECLGAEIQARMAPRDEADRKKMADFGMDGRPDRVLTTRDLAPGPLYVIATGVTDGGLLKGVRYFGDGARTHSIVMDLEASTVRFIDTVHLLRPTIIREIRL